MIDYSCLLCMAMDWDQLTIWQGHKMLTQHSLDLNKLRRLHLHWDYQIQTDRLHRYLLYAHTGDSSTSTTNGGSAEWPQTRRLGTDKGPEEETLEEKWTGPHQELVVTPTVAKVEGRNSWTHSSRCRKVLPLETEVQSPAVPTDEREAALTVIESQRLLRIGERKQWRRRRRVYFYD